MYFWIRVCHNDIYIYNNKYENNIKTENCGWKQQRLCWNLEHRPTGNV